MVFYIRNINTFAAMSMHECGQYRLSFDNRTLSSITVPAELYGVEGNIICSYETGVRSGWCGVITGLSVNTGTTTVQASPIISLFDTDYVNPRGSVSAYTSGCNGLIWDVITRNYINSTDTVYQMPWLRCYYNTDTKKAEPDYNNAGLFNLKEYIDSRIESCDTKLEVYLTSSYISLAFGSGHDDAAVYDFTTGRHQLIKEAYSSNVVARITTHTSDDADPPVWTSADYYLLSDGTYTQSAAAAGRVHGTWKHIYNPNDTDVADTFAKNQYKADIEFYSDKLPSDFIDYHSVSIKLENGKIISSVINSITLSSDDKRYKISTGLVVSSAAAYIRKAFDTAEKTAAQVAALRRS